MKEIAIFGAGGLGRETAASLDRLTYENPDGWNLIGFFDDTREKGSMVGDLGPVLGGLSELNTWPSPLNVVLCLGYPKDRVKVAERIINPNISYPNLIHCNFYCSHPSSFKIGQGNVIQGGCSASTDISIEDFNIFNGGVSIGHDASIGSFNSFMPRTLISGTVTIGNMNQFGANCFIVERLTVENNVNVGPLSVLLTKPKSGKTYVGNPAKILNY